MRSKFIVIWVMFSMLGVLSTSSIHAQEIKSYVIFLTGIGTESTVDNPVSTVWWQEIGATIMEEFEGWDSSQFVYFSYGARRNIVNPCEGWLDGCDDNGNLENINSHPTFDDADTKDYSLVDHAALLDWLISQVVNAPENQNVDVEIHLVGHSLGGIISAYWGARTSANSPYGYNQGDNVKTISTIESPLGGIPLAREYLECDPSILDYNCRLFQFFIVEFFGHVVSGEMQTVGNNGYDSNDLVPILNDVVLHYPTTIIESPHDYMVSDKGIPIRLLANGGLVLQDVYPRIGRGARLWSMGENGRYFDNTALGGSGLIEEFVEIDVNFLDTLGNVLTILELLKLRDDLLDNHNAPVHSLRTARWVVQAISGYTQQANCDYSQGIHRILTYDGEEANNNVVVIDASSDGRYVLFSSGVSNLLWYTMSDLATQHTNLFRLDRVTCEIVRLENSQGWGHLNGSSNAVISADGSFVVASASAFHPYHYIFDFTTENSTPVLFNINGNNVVGSSTMNNPSLSHDNRYLVFVSSATNLVSGDTNGKSDLYIQDLETGLVRRLTDNSLNNSIYNPAISGDGNYIVFASEASNIVPNDNNNRPDIFLYSLLDDTITLVTRDINGHTSNGGGSVADISFDGSYIVFATDASNLLGAEDDDFVVDVFLYDRVNDTISKISETYLGADSAARSIIYAGNHSAGSISADNRFIVYLSNIDPDDPSSRINLSVFVFDMETGARSLVSRAFGTSNYASPGHSPPLITQDGNDILFYSAGNNLVPNDTNNHGDTFIVDMAKYLGLAQFGDCNADSTVDAGDLSALQLEIFDGDSANVLDDISSGFAGNPIGCDSNADTVIDAGDLSCTQRIIFDDQFGCGVSP